MKRNKCPHCGGKMPREYQHSINRSLVLALEILSECLDGTANISRIGLTHNQICNFHKLKYWGLVEHLGGGVWKVSRRGYEFLDDDVYIPERVHTICDEVVRYSGSLITASFYISTAYLTREDYAKNSKNSRAEEGPTLFNEASK
jgi:hypothetical protein